ncbi:hypothetical protein GSI_13200 [Ganoderma sinense ZZ0214-1]|uniref:Uncharacterized protein n=1 Tax=Ganoderma sinense ZZ0214-1 TaxID=1077348 RepID=A0A2G8RUX4_9APHY|nr:hypothetical protein GSI_13200 [Ganoderma sinense ZZ0214-1]
MPPIHPSDHGSEANARREWRGRRQGEGLQVMRSRRGGQALRTRGRGRRARARSRTNDISNDKGAEEHGARNASGAAEEEQGEQRITEADACTAEKENCKETTPTSFVVVLVSVVHDS